MIRQAKIQDITGIFEEGKIKGKDVEVLQRFGDGIGQVSQRI